MWFYYEGYHDTYHAAALEDLWSRGARDGDQIYEPIRIPAILNWLAIVTIAVCAILAVIHGLS
jgi:hypothetical protein